MWNSIKHWGRQIKNVTVDQVKRLKLEKNDLIEQSTSQKLGSFTGVQTIVTAQYFIINDKLKLWEKVIETECADQIAAPIR